MSNKKELKEHVMLSFTPTEKEDLRDIAKRTLGNENMSQMVRYWITKYKDDSAINIKKPNGLNNPKWCKSRGGCAHHICKREPELNCGHDGRRY
jgi:hypothetical protein